MKGSWQERALVGADEALAKINEPSWVLAAKVQETILVYSVEAVNDFKLRVLGVVEAERLQAIEVAMVNSGKQAFIAQRRIKWCQRLWHEIAYMPSLDNGRTIR